MPQRSSKETKPSNQKQKVPFSMTTQQVLTGINPIGVSFGVADLTEITSGGSGGDEFVKLIMPAVSPDPSLIGKRHTLSLKTQSSPSDKIKVQIYDPAGNVAQSMAMYDTAGNILAVMNDGLGILSSQEDFLSFVWNGVHIALDDTAKNNDSPVLAQYMPSPVGHADGEILKIVGGVPTWTA